MKRIILALLAVLLMSAVFAGCASKGALPGAAKAAEQTEITGDLLEIDSLGSELDISELDSLDQEFSELDTLFAAE